MLRAGLLLVLITVAAPLRAADGIIAGALDNPQTRGEATFRWLGLPLYTARLFALGGQAVSLAGPLALRLDYARRISRQSLLDATVSELERLEGSSTDHAVTGGKLAPCFRDVYEGDSFVATATRPDKVELYFNGAPTCRVPHDNIGPRFLSIRLWDNSRSPRLSRQLRGGQ